MHRRSMRNKPAESETSSVKDLDPGLARTPLTPKLVESSPVIPSPDKRRFHIAFRQIFHILFFSILLGGIGVSVWLAQQKQDIRKEATVLGTELEMVPANKTVSVGEEFSVAVTIDTGDDTVSSAELHIRYDPALLEGQSFINGSFLPMVLTPGSIGDGNGAITLGSQPTEPKKGLGILAGLSFKAQATGTSAITLLDTTRVAAIGKTDNALTGMFNAQITITAAGPSPTPTPTPTSACITKGGTTSKGCANCCSGNCYKECDQTDSGKKGKCEWYCSDQPGGND